MSNRIVITTDYLHPGDTVDTMLREHGLEPLYSPAGRARGSEERLALFSEAVGAIAASEPITREMLAAAPRLKVIARAGVGYDNVDIDAARELGIRVCNTPGVNHHAVAEMALALMLACARRLGEVFAGVAEGGWPREAGTELRGKTLGVIGYGPSGRAIAALGSALGMRVLVSTAHPDSDSAQSAGIEFADFDTTIGSADYLTLHSRAGRNDPVIVAETFAAMKNSAVLINTARGSLVDEEALLSALNSGAIAGAGLDVLQQEPIVADNLLRTMDNVVITSHLAGQTVEARERAGVAAAQAVIDVLDAKTPKGTVV
ncbi:phosphoglycerate dehydrogenase [Brevibacterium marinum]|uniref:D-3-phosphoglycerate dehydrogenase/(S)-sulfolactate dehydrogenase n=1 Tax=Brevibacterium marinum TaxID=418643 RepID=A0A846RXI1_9MICO|nr:phosphoglycerate dehydrogenase [Brevibacterium marinum]NJC55353.1 D-3-phosphoglycerate dehydrogenase/(S)-sulfolactate dehydrogenase [Brevibacterium marinum]